MFLPRFRIVVVFALVLLAGTTVSAQDPSGRIAGLVADATGAVVPGATVELTTADGSIVRSTASDERGRYVFASVPVGRYVLSATFPSFDRATRDGVVATAGDETAVNVVLTLARQETAIVVTAPALSRPLVVETDPRTPRQPIPAHDGGDYLKNIPGFSLVRKGGADGDPVLRGMAGSRLGVLLDGQQIFGGCGGRMDPPTAYVYPAAYSRITVVKGPQSVLHAPGASAGVVLFERDVRRAPRPEVRLGASQVAGGFGRHDEMVDVRAAVPAFYLQAVGTRSQTGDYKDGLGAGVHSAYMRWSGSAAVGWTPADDTLLEVSATMSDGRAAYADRAMDGTVFARDNVALKFDTRRPWWVVRRVEGQAYFNYIDHVMDNFSLRTAGATFSTNNPDRRTTGGRVALTLSPVGRTSIVVGADTQQNVHTLRTASSKVSAAAATSVLEAARRMEDLRFSQIGVFGEASAPLTSRDRVIAGFRADWHEALDQRVMLGTSPNTTRGLRDRRTLASGFGRYERTLATASTVYVGFGHAERTPDYWERVKMDPVTLKSAFLTTRPEKTTQVDAGILWKAGGFNGSVSGFAGRIRDYILIRWSPAPTVTRNVNATTVGAEAEVSRYLTRHLFAQATLAVVRSTNDTDGKPLALQPPAEGTLGLTYANGAYSIGALARVVGAQRRVDVGSGNIVANGMDLGPTGGFSVFSLNGGYRIRQAVVVAFGIDNLLDRSYAEHISKGGAMVPGFAPTVRVNEPGRTAWVKLNLQVN